MKSSYSIYLFIILISFSLFKLTHLFMPYYWDELGVYSQAALYMFDHQVSLLPGTIPADLSRGHPLLCAAAFAMAFKLLGPHVWVGHLTALLFSCSLLLALYMLGKTIYSERVAFFACVLLALQPVFIAQSSLVLPEIMLALFCVLSLLAYLNGHLFRLALFSSLAIYTKETAIALPVSIIAVELLNMVINRTGLKKGVSTVGAVLIPLFLWGVFLLVQKQIHGWFFFPLHADYVSFSSSQVVSRLGYYLSFLFKGQGRYSWTILLLGSLVIYLSRHRPLTAAGATLIAAVKTRQADYVLIIYMMAALSVSMLNFHFARYTLFIVPVLCLFVSRSAVYLLEQFPDRRFYHAAIISIPLLPLFYYQSDHFTFDADMGFKHSVRTQLLVSEYIQANYETDTPIMGNFPIRPGLVEPRAGYVRHSFTNISTSCRHLDQDQSQILVYTYPGNLEYCTPDTKQLQLLKSYHSSFSDAYIYTRK